MRNLKKVFALFLSLAMALTLCVPALAANVNDYSDSETLTYVEQADVLSALEIVEGDETGACHPQEEITRAEAATIIARLILTRKIADSLEITTSRYTDMDKAAWAIQYVEACSNLDIINGDGANRFNPTGYVTGYEFAKMLLVAVGYGQNKEYVGNAWKMNVAIDANSIDLFAGTDATDLDTAATREQCFLYAFNALTGTDTVTYSVLLDTYTSTGLFKDEEAVTLGERVYGLGCAVTSELSAPNRKGVYRIGSVAVTDDLSESIGRSVRVWYTADNRGNTTAISNTYCNDVELGSNHYGYSYTAMTTPGKNGFLCKADSDIAVYVNGSRYDAHGFAYTISAVGGKKGAEVTFVDTPVNGLYDGVADKVFVLEKQVAQLSKDPAIRTISDTTTVMIDGITTSYLDADTVIGYEDVSYGDVVLYWTDAIGNLHIEQADQFIGTLSGTERLSDGGMGYVISDETYRLSDLTGASALTYSMYDISGKPSASYREYIYYVDNGGYIVAAIPVGENLSDYVMVAELAVIEPQGVDSEAYVQALLVDMNGLKKVVTVSAAILNADDLDENGLADFTATYKGIGINANNLISTAGGSGNYTVNAAVSALVGNTYWTYTETENGYVLSSVYTKTINGVLIKTGSLTRTAGDLNDIQSGKANFSYGLTGTSQTLFVIYNKLSNTFSVYQGVDNVPNVELASTAETAYIEVNGFVQYVFVGKNAIDASSLISENTAFLISTTPISDTFSTATNTGYGVYQAVVDGQLTTIQIKMSWQAVAAEGIGYKTVYYDGSYVVSMADNAKGMAAQAGYVVSAHTLRLADNAATSYTFNSDAKAYMIDSNRSADIAVTTVEELFSDNNDTVYVVIPAPNSTIAAFIVVYENNPAAAVSITTQPSDAIYSVGDDAAPLTLEAIAENSQTSYISYQWYVGEDSDFDHAEVIVGATSNSLAISTDTAGVYYYFCKVIHARTGMQTTHAISDPAVITVNEVVLREIAVSDEAMTLSEDDITFTAKLSEAVTGNVSCVLEWFGGNGWTEVGAAASELSGTVEMECTFEAAFNAEGRYRVTYTITAEGYKAVAESFTTELTSPAE